MQISEFKMRIMKIMKIIKLYKIITKILKSQNFINGTRKLLKSKNKIHVIIMKIIEFDLRITKTHENLRISYLEFREQLKT